VKSIKSTILTFAILATLIPSVGLGVLSFWRYQVIIGDSAARELRALAGDARSEVTAWFRERVAEVRALSAANMLNDALAGDATARPGSIRIGARELEHYLRSVQGKLEPILELTVSDPSGRPVASSAAAPAAATLPATWPGATVTEGAIANPPRWDPGRKTATLTVVVPILSPRNELLGALSAVLDLGRVRPGLEALVASSPADVILLTQDGVPLVAARAAVADLAPLDPAALARLAAAPGEAQTVTGHLGREALAVGDAPRVLPVLIVAERDRAQLYAAWLELLRFFALLVAGLVVVVGAIAYGVGRAIVRPLQGLTDAADRVARDDLTVNLAPGAAGEVGQLTRVFNLMVERLRASRAEIAVASEALQKQNALLEALAVTDGLTGVYNRQKFNDVVNEYFLRFCRNHRAFAVLMVDIDHFKAINDTHGHAAGDNVLAHVAAILRQSVRAIDRVARYGGEEFVAVLPDTTTEAGVEVAERVRAAIERHHLTNNEVIAVTVSIGVAHSRDEDLSPDDVVERADQALYAAKREGRNTVRAAA
jgi:diguanylate cyclase (GGDEF)-like protein